jgi:cell division protein YceG involved in septum cleavage
MYFVANPDGSSKFAKELDEHNANVAQYRQQQPK